MDLKLEVKECAGIGATAWQVHVVVPLPEGAYQDTSTFRVTDTGGTSIPAQFEILNRWWDKDNSIVNVVVRFEATVGAFTTAGTGITEYFLKDDSGINPPHASPIVSTDTTTEITVNTGATTVTINKTAGTITTTKGLLEADFGFLDPTNSVTSLQKSLSRTDIIFEVETVGALYTVVKLSAPTLYTSSTDHTHGWAIRLYFYAGKSYVKVDYQLQNSCKTIRDPVSMYFKYLNLTLTTGEASTVASAYSTPVNSESDLAQRGSISANSAQATIRNWAGMHPNGLNVDSAGKVTIELWPLGGEMLWADFANALDTTFPQNKITDKYWLDDMMHAYKECLINFGTATAQETSDLTNTFQFHPVVSIPVAQHHLAKSFSGFDGYVPYIAKRSATDIRVPDYTLKTRDSGEDSYGRLIQYSGSRYKFSWNTFGGATYRRFAPNSTGGIAFYSNQFAIEEDPKYYFSEEACANAELNMRPMHLAGYDYATDQAFLMLTHTPYGSRSWRRIGSNGDTPSVTQLFPLADSGFQAKPHDSSHAWLYHVTDSYKATANPWIKDWLVFIGQFRRTSVLLDDSFPDFSSRGLGHAINNALDAYMYTGDIPLLDAINATYIPAAQARFSALGVNNSAKNKISSIPIETPFQLAYFTHALSNLYKNTSNATHRTAIEGIVDKFGKWMYEHSCFGYYQEYDALIYNSSRATSSAAIDAVMWIGKLFDRPEYAGMCQAFIANGVNGGQNAGGGGAAVSDYTGLNPYGQVYTGFLAGDYPIAGSGVYDSAQSLSGDGQPVTISIDTIAVDNVLSAAEASTYLNITGTSNARDGTLVSVFLNGNQRDTFVSGGVFDLSHQIFQQNTSANVTRQFSAAQLASLVDGQTYPVTANVVSTADGARVSASPASLLINLTGGALVTIQLNEISGNLIDLTERGQDLIIDGSASDSDGNLVTVTFNGINYTDTVVASAFSVTVPSADLLALSSGQVYIASASITDGGSGTVVDTEDVTTDFTAPPEPAGSPVILSVYLSATAPSQTMGKVLAVDVDVDQVLTFSISNDPSGLFSIDSATGVITAINPSVTGSYQIEITATDNATVPLQETKTVHVEVYANGTTTEADNKISTLQSLIDAITAKRLELGRAGNSSIIIDLEAEKTALGG